jgi:type I restriction enzyme M protein
MPPPRTKDSTPTPTTAQSLGALLKSARDIMRKDKGLNGDLDRLPLLTWIMFLKFLDDLETQREIGAALAGKKFRPAIDPPYRWRDWAASSQGITGDELLAFINQDETTRPDGTKGAGLFAYLRGLMSSNGDDRRDVIATVFKGVDNRMRSGYLLRDVVNKVAGIHFTASDELHTLGALYESMLREMRDAAGDSGEFYTPRPVVRLMVAVTDPQLGEVVLDPAAGTGGFLVETFNHLNRQVKTVEERRTLQERSIYGCEPKPLPYLLCQMNLLLHGLDAPRIDPSNALRFKLSEIGERDRVDVILTNPPFGGEEERGIQGNFPEDRQTAETALLFLQLIMRKLKRHPASSNRPARAAVVVPNGVLYATGVAARIRTDLVRNFNLHTIVRLPKGVFEPYADIPTNILFFDSSGPTSTCWFYEHPLPAKRAALRSPSYSKMEPLLFDEFLPLIHWWEDRRETRQAWAIECGELAEDDFNLDRKNPNAEARSVAALADQSRSLKTAATGLTLDTTSLASWTDEIDKLSADADSDKTAVPLGSICSIVKGSSPTQKTPAGPYTFVVTAAERKTADSFQFDEPAVCVPLVSSTGHGHASIHRIHFETGRFALANIMAAVLVRDSRVRPKFLYYYLWRYKEEKLVSLMAGTANTSLTLRDLETVTIEFPDLPVQDAIVDKLDRVLEAIVRIQATTREMATISGEIVTNSLRTLL